MVCCCPLIYIRTIDHRNSRKATVNVSFMADKSCHLFITLIYGRSIAGKAAKGAGPGLSALDCTAFVCRDLPEIGKYQEQPG